jgi:thiol-disulfide isomerase/thioredoxin
MIKFSQLLSLAAWLLVFPPMLAASDTPAEHWWVSYNGAGEPQIHLYFFWTPTCPHCQRAKPFVEKLPEEYPWLVLHSYDVTTDMAGRLRYLRMAKALGEEAGAVPAFLACQTMTTGYDHTEGTGRHLRTLIEGCYQQLTQAQQSQLVPPKHPPQPEIDIPFFGKLAPQSLSLPALTLVLAGLDAFNPCAFFVLLFLLSLLVHARQRGRMLLIGGIFIFFSGFIYFVFMAAWLNAFLLLGQLPLITLIAGLLAVVMGLFNVKDYFWFQRGPSLSIPEAAKPHLFRRMRNLVSGEHLPSLVLGAITLAIAANSYELLCTAGFPMVYTRTLTLNELSTGTYYLYLVIYNILYVVPLLAIMLVFVYALGSRKLKESEGRVLKLLSGNMMLGLGMMLLFYPQGLSHAGIAILVLAAALGCTGVVVSLSTLMARKPMG